MGNSIGDIIHSDKAKLDISKVNSYISDLRELIFRLENVQYTTSGIEKSSGYSKKTMQTTYDNMIKFTLEYKEFIESLIEFLNETIGTFQQVDELGVAMLETGGNITNGQ